MHDSMTAKTHSNSPVLQKKLPFIASLRRRLFAFAIDSIILGLVALVIGKIFAAPLSNLGPYGRPLGYLFFIPYFGIMNSKICSGQTLGKKILNIAIRNNNNESIGVGRSIIHTLCYVIPLSLYGLSIPLNINPFIFGLVNIFLFGLAGALFFPMIFNRSTHQGLHDILLGTYVINRKKKSIQEYPNESKKGFFVSASWSVIIILFFIGLYLSNPTNFIFSKITGFHIVNKNLLTNPDIFTTNIKIRTTYLEDGAKQHDLIVDSWVKGELTYDEKMKICSDTIYVAYKSSENIETYDNLRVNIITGYDIGIAKSNNTIFCTNTIPILKDWFDKNFPN